VNQPGPEKKEPASAGSQSEKATSSAAPASGGATAPPTVPDYDLLRRIGKGAYGEVWIARNRATGVLRAAKIVWRHTFEDNRPFEREFEGIQKFERISRDHPSQLALFHIGQNEAEGYFYYVMELADAAPIPNDECRMTKEIPMTNDQTEASDPTIRASDFGLPSSFDIRHSSFYTPHTLRSDLQHGRLSASRVLEIGLALSEALGHLHSHGLVHRDVKPSNVIFVNGRPKLADIGLVTDASDTCSIVGTEGYLPPEGPGTPQADIFALGKVLYEAATGLGRKQFPQLPSDLLGWPDSSLILELNEILLKACSVDARQRYQNAKAMHADLALRQAGKSILQRRAWERRWAWIRKAALTTALIGIVTTAFLFAKREITRRSAASKSSVTTFETSGTTNREAYNAYRMGRLYWWKRTADGLTNAIAQFEEAIRLDTKFARAYAGLADSYDLLDTYAGVSPEEIRPKAHAAVLRALELDPTLAEAHTSLGKYKFVQEWDWTGAEHEFQKALKLDMNYALAHFWYADYLATMGRFEDAIREGRRALELKPTSLIFNITLGLHLIYARDYDRAIAQYREAVKIDPYFAEAHHQFGLAYFLAGQYDEAIAEWEKYEQLWGENPSKVAARRAAYKAGGMEAYWRKGMEQTKEQFAGKPLPALGMAKRCAVLGDVDDAFGWLDLAYKERRDDINYLNVDPVYDRLRSDPRFGALLQKLRLEPRSR